MTTTPERALACVILRHAVKAWKRAEPESAEGLELVRFFRGSWCGFLWDSVMSERLEVVLEVLGVPGTLAADGVFAGGWRGRRAGIVHDQTGDT